MKWIGQHIYDLIARFRSDVYLEDISTGTIASGGNLGLDSDNKIVKATISSGGSGDITEVNITTDSGGGSVASETTGSADFSILGATGVGVTNSGTTITATAVPSEIDHDSLSNFVAAEHYDWSSDISGTATVHTNNITDLHGAGVDGSDNQLLTDGGDGSITSESNLTFDGSTLSLTGDLTVEGDTITLQSDNADDPKIVIQNNYNNNQGARLQMKKNRGAAQVNSDNIAEIDFFGEDAGQNQAQYAKMLVRADEVTDGQESGDFRVQVAAHNATLTQGLKLVGGSESGEVDVTIGAGANSLTSVEGSLQTGGSIELGHANDTTLARSASGVATIEGKKVQTRDKVIFMETSNFSDDINTDAHYIPFITTSENTNFANVAVPFVAPTAGKLLGVHYRSNVDTNTSSNTVTFRLDRIDDGVLWSNGNEATIGTKVVDGTAREDTCSADFQDLTTSGASGTNAFDAGEMIGVSMQNSQNLISTKYSVTLVFEFDFNSY